MKGLLLGFFLSTLIAASIDWTAQNRVLAIAESYVGTNEVAGPNRHPAIDDWNQNVDVPVGSSYCASFVSYVLDSAKVQYPVKRTALAQGLITNKSIKASQIWSYSSRRPIRGFIVIWKKGETWMGHTGFVRYKKGSTFYTIEANTSPSDQGDQRNGDGVWKKQRHIDPTAYFRITHFTPVY